jgi:hypothetical protein
MSHRDLPAERTAYHHFYDHDGAAENAFGSEMLAARPNSALHDHLQRGGSMLTFPRASIGSAGLEVAYASIDAKAAAMRAMKVAA